MKKSITILGGTLFSSMLLSGCASKITQEVQYSNFLPNYQNLEETTSSSGEPVLRWVAKSFNPNIYSTVVFDRLELYPAPQPDEKVDLTTLQELQALTSTQVKGALAQKYQVVPTLQQVPAGSRTIIMHAAITGVSASTQGMRWYEILPITAVVGAVSAVVGERDQDTELYIEADWVDASTGLPVAKVVRKVYGASLENNKQMISSNDFKAAIKGLTTDMNHFIN